MTWIDYVGIVHQVVSRGPLMVLACDEDMEPPRDDPVGYEPDGVLVVTCLGCACASR